MTGGEGQGLWFSSRNRRPDAAAQLFCLPYAGGGASTFVAWPKALGDGVEVNAVALPGRERRMAEAPVIDPVAVAAAIAARADRPYAIFGHSMGAAVAFEAVRELRAVGADLPVHLYVSGCQAPDLGRTDCVYSGLSAFDDAALLDRLATAGGLPAEVLATRELMELMLPVFRADFAWLDTYVYRWQVPLPIPISAFAGENDESAPVKYVDAWAAHTSADFALYVLPGGHFFLRDHLAAMAETIRADLRAAVS